LVKERFSKPLYSFRVPGVSLGSVQIWFKIDFIGNSDSSFCSSWKSRTAFKFSDPLLTHVRLKFKLGKKLTCIKISKFIKRKFKFGEK
jgi:hypothetical protein